MDNPSHNPNNKARESLASMQMLFSIALEILLHKDRLRGQRPASIRLSVDCQETGKPKLRVLLRLLPLN
jgi:hypothetical protein